MPTSNAYNIAPIIDAATHIKPKSVLDLGIGWGKYGALLREYLDGGNGALSESLSLTSPRTVLVGYEGFEQYRNPMWDLYDTVHITDIIYPPLWERFSNYDLVLLIDSLEHLEREVGEKLLQHLVEKNKNVIVSCPDGDYPQGAVYGNEYERHRSVWCREDFEKRGAKILYHGVCTVALFGEASRV